jgi:hypothetical protein
MAFQANQQSADVIHPSYDFTSTEAGACRDEFETFHSTFLRA